MPVAWLREEVAAVKAAHPDIPVFGVGAALSVEEAEEVVRDGIADMVALTRAQIGLATGTGLARAARDPQRGQQCREEDRETESAHCRRSYRLAWVGSWVASANETLTDANAASMYGPEVTAK